MILNARASSANTCAGNPSARAYASALTIASERTRHLSHLKNLGILDLCSITFSNVQLKRLCKRRLKVLIGRSRNAKYGHRGDSKCLEHVDDVSIERISSLLTWPFHQSCFPCEKTKMKRKQHGAGKCAGSRNNTVLSAKTTKTQNTTPPRARDD